MNHFGKGGWINIIQMTFRIVPLLPSGFDRDEMFCALSLTSVSALTKHKNYVTDT